MSLAALVGCTPEINSRLPKPPASNSIASETRDEPPVSTTMPSAWWSGLISAPCICERKPTKPTAAPTNTIASAATIVARSRLRGATIGAFRDLSSEYGLMCCWRPSPHSVWRGTNRHPAPSFCLSMISAQTLRVCREGKPVPTFPDHALKRFQTKWSLAGAVFMQTASVDLVQRGEQRTPRCPGGDRRDQRSLRRQRQITGRAQRKRPQQSCELIPDRGA